MPHTSSAEKRLRQNEKRQQRNRAAKKAIRVQIKKLLSVVKDGPGDGAQAEFKLAMRRLDKAAAKRVIHPNTAARKKSQLARLVGTRK